MKSSHWQGKVFVCLLALQHIKAEKRLSSLRILFQYATVNTHKACPNLHSQLVANNTLLSSSASVILHRSQSPSGGCFSNIAREPVPFRGEGLSLGSSVYTCQQPLRYAVCTPGQSQLNYIIHCLRCGHHALPELAPAGILLAAGQSQLVVMLTAHQAVLPRHCSLSCLI